MPEAVHTRELVPSQRRRLRVFLRALLPAATDAENALKETLRRIAERSREASARDAGAWVESIARQVAQEQRKAAVTVPFSDDLFRQIADSAGPSLQLSERRPQAMIELLAQLPPPEKELIRRKYELGMTVDQIARAEDRPSLAVSRELAALHESLVNLLRQSLRDHDVPPPGGAADLGRLTDQLLDGTITDDGRLILETLLLADAAAQAHYHRHGALTVELDVHYRGEPAMTDPKVPTRRPLSTGERLVTGFFLLAILVAAGFAAYVVYLWLR